MEISKKIELAGAIIVWIAFGSIGIFCLLRYIKYFAKSRSSRFWKKTTGKIIESRVESFMNADALDFTYVVKFQYEVEGVKYVSDRIFFKSYDFSDENYTKKYPIEKEVTVFYNPTKVMEAVLENGIKAGLHFFLIMSIVLFSVCVLIYNVFIQDYVF